MRLSYKAFFILIIAAVILIEGLLFFFNSQQKNQQVPSISPNITITPFPTRVPESRLIPPVLKTVPTLTQDPGSLDPNAAVILASKEEIKKLVPYLPYTKDLTLSTGVKVTISIPSKELQDNENVLTAYVLDLNYQTSPEQADYTLMKNSFLEASFDVFEWVKNHGADPKKIIFAWGDRAYIQKQAELWLTQQ